MVFCDSKCYSFSVLGFPWTLTFGSQITVEVVVVGTFDGPLVSSASVCLRCPLLLLLFFRLKQFSCFPLKRPWYRRRDAKRSHEIACILKYWQQLDISFKLSIQWSDCPLIVHSRPLQLRFIFPRDVALYIPASKMNSLRRLSFLPFSQDLCWKRISKYTL